MGARGRGARKRRTVKRQAMRARATALAAAADVMDIPIEPIEVAAAGGAVAQVECANCGKMNDAEAARCSECGAALGSTEASIETVEAPEFDMTALKALAAIAASAAGDLVWDAEDGVMDLMADLSEMLNPGDSWRWCVVDVATSLDRAILADWDANETWLAPFTVGADKEPVLSPKSEWKSVESAWVQSDERYVARLAQHAAFAAAGQSCSNCEHAFADHSGDTGPCMAEGCSCTGYAAMPTDKDGDEPSSSPLSISEDSVLAIAEALELDPTDAPRIRVALEQHAVPNGTGTAANWTFDLTVPVEESRVHDVTPSPEPIVPLSGEDGAVEWTAIFAPEGKLTSDGRAFAPGSISWRELPLTLMAMIETSEGGHIGAEVAGRIDRIWRDEAAGLIRAAGVFADTEYGSLIAAGAAADPEWFDECLTASLLETLNASLVTNQTLRGVSVDLAISRYEVGPKSDWFDEDGNWAPKAEESEPAAEEEPSLLDILFGEEAADSIAVVLEAEIGMTTVCPFPAFAEAKIAVGQSLVAGANPAIWTITSQAAFTVVRAAPGGALTASVALAAPPSSEPCVDCEEPSEALTGWRPALSSFTMAEPDGPCPITIGDDRTFTAHLALWETCHIGIQGRCQQPPPSKTDYRFFHLGEVLCADGERINVGTVTIDTGHAASGLGRAAATSHYDDTGSVTAYVVARDGEHGIFVSGVIPEFVPEETVEVLRGAKLSGDWRKVEGHLELVAILTVNVPGFPVPRARQLVAGGELVSLVASGIPIFDDEIPPEYREKFAALAAADRFATLAAEAC